MPLSVWLVLIPEWLSLLLVTVFFTGFGVGAVLLVRKFVHHSILKKHNEIAGFVFATVGVIYGVMLAFVVIGVWEQYEHAKEVASNEAMQVYALYRDLSMYPDHEQTKPAIEALAWFSLAVVEKEYPAVRQWKWETPKLANVETRWNMEKLWDSIYKITPKTGHELAIYSEVINNITSLGQERQKRLVISRHDLPEAIWVTVILGGLITLGFTALFGSENIRGQIVITTLLGIVLSLTIFVVIILNSPFVGSVSIKPEGYERVISFTGWGEKLHK
jgi:hypothetical protein